MPFLQQLAHVNPNLALLLATAGMCLILLELNRPGLILPGSTGLLLTLLAVAALLHHPLSPRALILLLVVGIILALNLYRRLPLSVLCAATLALILGLRFLLPSSQKPISLQTAVFCGSLIGSLAALLSRVALRARRAKAIH